MLKRLFKIWVAIGKELVWLLALEKKIQTVVLSRGLKLKIRSSRVAILNVKPNDKLNFRNEYVVKVKKNEIWKIIKLKIVKITGKTKGSERYDYNAEWKVSHFMKNR